MIALSYHLKGVVFMPVFLAAAAFSSRGRQGRWYRVAAITSLIGLTIVAIPYWIGRFRCPSDRCCWRRSSGRRTSRRSSSMRGRSARRSSKLLEGLNPVDLYPADRSENAEHVQLAATLCDRPWPGACLDHPHHDLLGLLRARGDRRAGRACPAGRGRRTQRPEDRPALLLIIATVMAWSTAQIHKNVYESSLTASPTIISFILL